MLDDEKVAVEPPDDLERVERTVIEVGEGILGQDFEPQPVADICAWCDYRLICPALARLRPRLVVARPLAQEALEVVGDRVA